MTRSITPAWRLTSVQASWMVPAREHLVAPGLQQARACRSRMLSSSSMSNTRAVLESMGEGTVSAAQHHVVHLGHLGGLEQDAEHGAAARPRGHLQACAPSAAPSRLTIARPMPRPRERSRPRVAHLVELVEDAGQLVLGWMPMPVSHTSMACLAGAVARHHHHAAFRGVADGVVDQVAQHALQQVRVARDDLAARLEAQRQAPPLGLAGAVHVQHAGTGRGCGKDCRLGSITPASSLEMSSIALNDCSSASIERIMLRLTVGCSAVPLRLLAPAPPAKSPSACIGWRRSWLAEREEAALLVVGLLHQHHLLAQRPHQRVVVELGLQRGLRAAGASSTAKKSRHRP